MALDINGLTGKIIGCAFRVSNTLGSGFLERVYENVLAIELRRSGLCVVQQASVEVRYRGRVVGEYLCDLVVEDAVVVEVKAIRCLTESHYAQCIDYLKATHLSFSLLLNFGQPRMEYRRIVCTP